MSCSAGSTCGAHPYRIKCMTLEQVNPVLQEMFQHVSGVPTSIMMLKTLQISRYHVSA